MWLLSWSVLYNVEHLGEKNKFAEVFMPAVTYNTNNVVFMGLATYYSLVLLVSYLLGIAICVDFLDFVQDSQLKSGCRQDSMEGL